MCITIKNFNGVQSIYCGNVHSLERIHLKLKREETSCKKTNDIQCHAQSNRKWVCREQGHFRSGKKTVQGSNQVASRSKWLSKKDTGESAWKVKTSHLFLKESSTKKATRRWLFNWILYFIILQLHVVWFSFHWKAFPQNTIHGSTHCWMQTE